MKVGFELIEAKRGNDGSPLKEEEEDQKRGKMDPDEPSILWRDNESILWEILYQTPLKRLGLICSTSNYIRTVCRDIRFRRIYVKRNINNLEEMFLDLLDHEPPLESTFILWGTLSQNMQIPWDPNMHGAAVFNTSLLRKLPECVKVFVPESQMPMPPYPGVLGLYIDQGIAWCAQNLHILLPNSNDFLRIGQCLEVLLQSLSATLSFQGSTTLEALADIGVGTWFAQAHRLATDPVVVAYLAANRNALMSIAARSDRASVIRYMLSSDQINKTYWWPHLDVHIFDLCIVHNHVIVVLIIMQQWDGLIAALNNHGLELLESAIAFGRTIDMAEFLLEHKDDIPYNRAFVLYLMDKCIDRAEGGQLDFDYVREALNTWYNDMEFPDDDDFDSSSE